MGIAQNALSWADPGVWSAHAFLEPLDVDYDPNVSGGNTRVLMMPTAGDSQVPTQTGIAMARTAGVLGSWLRDEDIGPEHGWREIFVPDERLGTARCLLGEQHLRGRGRPSNGPLQRPC